MPVRNEAFLTTLLTMKHYGMKSLTAQNCGRVDTRALVLTGAWRASGWPTKPEDRHTVLDEKDMKFS